MAYIKVIDHHEAEGELRDIYDDLVKTRGKLADVHKIQSLNPKSIVNHMDLYMTIMFGKSSLKRYQRELMAVVVSSTNECPYCITHHAEALNHFWKDDIRLNKLIENFEKVNLTDADLALARFASSLTLKPNSIQESNQIKDLKDAGFSDSAILDANLVCSYFNFVNRMVLGLGVQLEEDGGKGYEYS